jgi:hypothetical protein
MLVAAELGVAVAPVVEAEVEDGMGAVPFLT